MALLSEETWMRHANPLERLEPVCGIPVPDRRDMELALDRLVGAAAGCSR